MKHLSDCTVDENGCHVDEDLCDTEDDNGTLGGAPADDTGRRFVYVRYMCRMMDPRHAAGAAIKF